MPRMILPWAPKISGSALPTSPICTCAESTVWVTGLHRSYAPSRVVRNRCVKRKRERERERMTHTTGRSKCAEIRKRKKGK
jgi:hypothetical protein